MKTRIKNFYEVIVMKKKNITTMVLASIAIFIYMVFTLRKPFIADHVNGRSIFDLTWRRHSVIITWIRREGKTPLGERHALRTSGKRCWRGVRRQPSHKRTPLRQAQGLTKGCVGPGVWSESNGEAHPRGGCGVWPSPA